MAETGSGMAHAAAERMDAVMRWPTKVSLTSRILAVNLLPLLLLGGGIFYLDNYRTVSYTHLTLPTKRIV